MHNSFDVTQIEPCIKNVTEEYKQNLKTFEQDLQSNTSTMDCELLLARIERMEDSLEFSWGLVHHANHQGYWSPN